MEAFLKQKPASVSLSEKKKPWVEKYRPKTIEELASQEEIKMVLQKSIERNDLPNLLFYGPPGTGKTSAIIAAAKDLFGSEYRDRILELNASDERGIKVIREKVKTFAQNTVTHMKNSKGELCPSFKIVILDEADSMTTFAQAALRRIMEKECKNTRFCIICNYISRIIEPITSRCAKFRFKSLPSEIMVKKLAFIAQQENITVDDKTLAFIVDVSDGDLRKAITYLQSAHKFIDKSETGNQHATINQEDICEIAGVIPDEWIRKILEFILTAKHHKIINFVEDFMKTGYAISQLMYQLSHIILNPPGESAVDLFHERFGNASESDLILVKCALVEKCADIEYHLLDGADEELQFTDFLAYSIDCILTHLINK